jgi:hypothetical protein
MSDEPQVQDETFFVDEFFATDEDPGVTVGVKIKGRLVPITFKSGLTVEDKAKAQAKAIKRRVTGDGRLVVDEINESEAAIYMLAVSIKDWPFTERATGKKLPITVENIRKMLGGADEMAEVIQKIDQEGAAALVPFAPASAEV